MLIFTLFLFIITGVTQTLGMECAVGKGFLPDSCPRIFDESSQKYCCFGSDKSYRCCDLSDYSKQQGMNLLLIVCILVPIIAVVACCVCCLCCPFCLIYKRRHRGAVYGRTSTEGVVIQPNVPPTGATTNVTSYPAYPPYQPPQQPMPMPMPYGAPPPYPAYPQTQHQQAPPYSATTTEEMYPRQAAYNPNFNS